MDQQIPSHGEEEEVHLQDYLNALLRRRRTFLAVFLTVFLGVVLVTFTSTPLYEASATLHVKDDKGRGGVLGELNLLNASNPIDAELEILRSRTNLEEVVRRLHLDTLITVEKGAPRLTILEFVPAEGDQEYRLDFTAADSFRVRDAKGTVLGEGRPGSLFQASGLRLVVGQAQCRAGDMVSIAQRSFPKVVEGLRGTIKASEVGNKTGIIRLTSRASKPERARDVVNTLVQVHLERSVASKAEEASRTVQFVEDQLGSVRSELDTAEKGLQSYKTASGLVQLDAEAMELIKKLSDTERQKADVFLQKKQTEFALASLKDARRRGGVYSPALLRDDTVVAALATKLSELEMAKRLLMEEHTEEHPAVRSVQGQIDEAQRKLQSTYESALASLVKQEAGVDRQLAEYDNILRGLPAAERELARLTRHAKVNADIYTFLLQKHEESRIVRASTISNISIVDPAIIPQNPVKPQKKKNLLLGLVVGCMLAVGMVFFREYMDDTVKNPEQARRLLGLPLLTVIPFMEGQEGEKGMACLTTLTAPRSMGSESFRSLRTALHFSATGKERKVLLVTSSFPGEGKSTISANLGVTITQTGAKVLLIDCDLRRPSLHERFGHSKAPGLTEIITGDVSIDDVLHSTGIEGLDFISSGTIPPNPAELLGSAAMARLLEESRHRYDQIILDAPPVLAVTDTPLLAASSDQIVVVVESSRVPSKAATRTREVLATAGRPVVGLVFNDRQNRGEGYGAYGYYGYGYSEGSAAEAVGWRQRVSRLLEGLLGRDR